VSHILFISHARGLHGAESVMVQALKACVSHGALVTMVVPSIAPDEGLAETLNDIPGVSLLALPYRAAGVNILRTILVGVYNLPALMRLKRYVRREKVDCIYSNTYVTILGSALARMTGVRHIWHWHEPVDAQYGWHASLTGLYRCLAKRADTVICISRSQQTEWEQTLGVSLHNAQIIYNPIKPLPSVLSDLLVPHEGVRIGFIGHFEKRKNIPLLVHVFEQLHAQHPDTSLWLCGATNEQDRTNIEHLTSLREPVLTVLPQTPDVASFYRQIDILVLPSWRETMPLVVLEAMQAGVCVLQTGKSGMKELVEDGKESLFFPPDQPDTLLQLLERCMDSMQRRQLALAGQEKAMLLIKNQSFDRQIRNLLCVS